MSRKVKKTIKIALITLASLIVLLLGGIALVINFVFTPEKLTPVVLKVANENLNAQVELGSVDLTFFSTFPNFSLKANDGLLVSKAINDSLWSKRDSLVSFKECLIAVNPIAYLRNNKIIINNIVLEDALVYAFKDKEGVSNWDIVKPSLTDSLPPIDTLTSKADSVSVEADTARTRIVDEIEIKNIELKNANITFNDRSTEIYARLDSANLKLKLSMSRKKSLLKLTFDNKNLIFWQQGEVILKKIATSLKTDIQLDRATRSLSFSGTELTVNGIKFDAQGSIARDTALKALNIDVEYGLHTPSVKTVLEMIPESVMKKTKVTAKGEVVVKGSLKGLYGEKMIPAAFLKIQINDASAKYSGFPYGIDHLSTDFEAYVDLMRNKTSYLDLKIFRFNGAHTEVVANAKVDNLLNDPTITVNTQSKVDLDALAKTFPLQEGVSISGKLDADLSLKCKLSALKNQDYGRMVVKGDLAMADLSLKHTEKDFSFTGNASVKFSGDTTLQAKAEIREIKLESAALTSKIERLTADISSSKPKDSAEIVNLECVVELNKLRARMGDSLSLYSAKTKAKVSISPGKRNSLKPLIKLGFKADSLYCRFKQSRMGLGIAGFDIQAEKLRDSVWATNGIVGFDKFFMSTPQFKLPIIISKTKVTIDKGDINLHNAAVRIGKSNMVASGSIIKPLRAIRRNETLKARLSISSDSIDCNQLVNALAFAGDSDTTIINDDSPIEIDETTGYIASTDTLPESGMRLFVIPANIELELQTNAKKVTYDKMLFENVKGLVDIKNQAVHLKELSMRALDADMTTAMVYKANKEEGYIGFDFKIKDINIGRLIEFIPSLDTLVPMLGSFKGYVDFDIVAESSLDSVLNIQIPTLRSAINISGDSLVLLDGETFAEISKMMMFKNKKQNVFDSIFVNITIEDGNVMIYPFLVEIDRYRVAVGGRQGLDMNFEYHISVLKSPVPFKLGVNITGNLDKMKIRIGSTKYKDAVTPAEIRRVDSTRVNMGNIIVQRFRRLINTGS